VHNFFGFVLKEIFSSGARVKVLKTFLLAPPDKEYFVRELTRLLDEQINSVRRELENLKKIGLLKARTRNRKKYFKVNEEFLIVNELRSIFRKCSTGSDDVAKHIARIGKVQLLILSGVFIGKDSGIDIFIVGDIDKSKLNQYISKELQFDKEVRYSVFSKEDFFYRLDCKDKFVGQILNDAKNIVLINKLENELKK